jgi:cbb3-type cytochrome oxidase maturation protein
MALLYIITGLALGIFATGVAALVWQVRDGQLDDLDTPALRVLGDDAPAKSGSSDQRQA